MTPTVNDLAPDFTLHDSTGAPRSLHELARTPGAALLPRPLVTVLSPSVDGVRATPRRHSRCRCRRGRAVRRRTRRVASTAHTAPARIPDPVRHAAQRRARVGFVQRARARRDRGPRRFRHRARSPHRLSIDRRNCNPSAHRRRARIPTRRFGAEGARRDISALRRLGSRDRQRAAPQRAMIAASALRRPDGRTTRTRRRAPATSLQPAAALRRTRTPRDVPRGD